MDLREVPTHRRQRQGGSREVISPPLRIEPQASGGLWDRGHLCPCRKALLIRTPYEREEPRPAPGAQGEGSGSRDSSQVPDGKSGLDRRRPGDASSRTGIGSDPRQARWSHNQGLHLESELPTSLRWSPAVGPTSFQLGAQFLHLKNWGGDSFPWGHCEKGVSRAHSRCSVNA